MKDVITSTLKRFHHFSHDNQGIQVVKVQAVEEGVVLASEILSDTTDPETVLFLSGGRTPKELYHRLSSAERLDAGAVGLVDERFGPKWHENSNELMIKQSGFLRYLQMRDIAFHPILSGDLSRELTTSAYDEKVRALNATFRKSIGILGVGLDGHTAGIAGNRHDFTNPMFAQTKNHLMVSEFDDQKGMYKERITMTFLGLSMLDLLLVLVFGDDKKDALEKMFANGSEEEVPSRFFKRPDIAPQTILITDQQV